MISCTDVTQDADIIGNCIILLDKQNYNELIMSMDLVKIESKLPEINKFVNLRDTLLPKLMSGEIDVSKIRHLIIYSKLNQFKF